MVDQKDYFDDSEAGPADGSVQDRTRKKWRSFFSELSRTGNVTKTCRNLGVSASQAYKLRERFPMFARAWDEAIEMSVDLMEYEARRRAVDGVDVPLYYKGELVDTSRAPIRQYDSSLLMFLLKGARPERYRDSYDHGKLISEFIASKADPGEPPKGGP